MGMKQHYGPFIGDYTSKHVYSRSTNHERTKASLLLTPAGFFLPKVKHLVWDKNLISRPEFSHLKYEIFELKKDILFESSLTAGYLNFPILH